MQITVRGAEWHYLYGVICTQRGWYDRAINELTQAVNMDPGNAEYAQFLHRVPVSYTHLPGPAQGFAGAPFQRLYPPGHGGQTDGLDHRPGITGARELPAMPAAFC